jgi:hypothetical protein
MKIWLDDMRPSPFPPRDGKFTYPFDKYAPYDIHCGNAHDAIRMIETGFVKFISFDHDLGDGGTGYDVAKYIEEKTHTKLSVSPICYKIHSANPVGSENIKRAMDSAWKVWNTFGFTMNMLPPK